MDLVTLEDLRRLLELLGRDRGPDPMQADLVAMFRRWFRRHPTPKPFMLV